MSDENSVTTPQGKGLGVAGFIMSLVGLIFAPVVAGIVLAGMALAADKGEVGGKGLMYFWVVFCIASVVLSAMGMMKLGKTGGKRGLAIAGLVIGIVGTIWALMLLMGLDVVQEGAETLDSLDRL
jgi:hypothetical protein